MIAFDLGEELDLVVQTAQRFADADLRPAARAASASRQVPETIVQKFVQMGLGLCDLPEHFGGMGLGLVGQTAIQEVLAGGDAGLNLALPQAGAMGRLLTLLGDPQQQRAFLAPFVQHAQRTWSAVALSESQPSNNGLLHTKAVRQKDQYLLHGRKSFVLQAGVCDHLIVLAQVNEDRGMAGIGAFMVPRHTAGVSVAERQTLVGLDVVNGADVVLHDVRIDAGMRLGEGDLMPKLDHFFAAESLLHAAQAVGVAQSAYAYALAYAQERHAFGKPIAHFQSIAFLLADMFMQLEAARTLVQYGAWAMDSQTPDAICRAHQARAQADEMAFFCTDSAVQILGGHGYIQDHPVEKWMRDVRALALLHGSREVSETRAAADLVNAPLTYDLLPLGHIQPVWS